MQHVPIVCVVSPFFVVILLLNVDISPCIHHISWIRGSVTFGINRCIQQFGGPSIVVVTKVVISCQRRSFLEKRHELYVYLLLLFLP